MGWTLHMIMWSSMLSFLFICRSYYQQGVLFLVYDRFMIALGCVPGAQDVFPMASQMALELTHKVYDRFPIHPIGIQLVFDGLNTKPVGLRSL